MMKKLVVWIPYAASQLFLGAAIVWLGIKHGMSTEESLMLSAAMVTYGALLVGSSDLRRYWNRKT